MQRPPIPPFTRDSALAKVRAAEDEYKTRDVEKIVQAYSPDCVWRNGDESYQGRAAIEYFLKRKWTLQLDSQLTKELWAFTDNRISVHFECEWQHAETGQWHRSHGNEHWAFNADGYMTHRDMSTTDNSISVHERRIGHLNEGARK